jgi:hypothetical protein
MYSIYVPKNRLFWVKIGPARGLQASNRVLGVSSTTPLYRNTRKLLYNEHGSYAYGFIGHVLVVIAFFNRPGNLCV